MNVYEQVHEMFRYHFETVDSKCIKALKEESPDYKKTHDELIALLNLTWFTDFLNGSLTESITSEQAKTILKYMELQTSLECELKTMYYINGMRDAFYLNNIFEQLND